MAKILALSALFFLSLFIASGAENPVSKAFMDMLTGTYTNNASELPEPSNLRPDDAMTNGPGSSFFENHCEGDSTTDCVYGWLDIIGFKNTVRIGNDYYIASRQPR